MSIQAVAWALEQDFSYTTPKGRQTSAHGAKLVLISLANHADHVSGHCWPSSETIARESSCNIRSVYRLIAALERNGFIEVKRVRGGTGKQRSNNYWIRFDRIPASWQFFEDDDNEQSDTVSCDSDAAEEAENASESATESPGQSDIGVTRHLRLEPSVLEPSEQTAQPTAAVALPTVPAGYQPTARIEQAAKLQAAEDARKPQSIPVIEGSDPWFAWLKYQNPEKGGRCHAPTLTTWVEVNGHKHRGWHFPTLWPPKETGPPAQLPLPDAKAS